MGENNSRESKFSRRSFLKISGAASATLGMTGLGFFGLQAGKSASSYTGRESFQGAAQSFNRKKFIIDKSPHVKVGQTSRIDARTEMIFARIPRLMRQWKKGIEIDDLDPLLKSFYKSHPDQFELDSDLINRVFPEFRKANKEYGEKYLLAQAWSNAMSAVWPEGINQPPEISDFPRGERYGEPSKPYKLKSPGKTSKLIKQMAYQFGSILVGITELNPDWVYEHPLKRRGFDSDKPFKVPDHWKYAIVVGTPMSWDPFYANPTYGTSEDAYSRSRIIAYRMAAFIKQLGYAARPHTPGTDYDLMVVPIAIDAGLGEQGRHSVLITPELGSNFRPAVITTNIPMKPDKPIKFGVEEFCKTCKICAENCPSGAITHGDKQVVRGYKRYQVNISKCHNFWYSNLGNIGCRLCVASCPYSRKSNWLHRTALKVTSNDPTGVSHKVLTAMQKSFYPSPDAGDYYIPSMGGKNASYREPPWWLKTEDFIDMQGG
ncbi:hypothetical protein DRQ07_05475 [candidate division KSB1 bacterium]|nr:MAG: hypothetical protein DRQ07_05475 [candidate division KSB1 bacterium]